MSRIRIRCRLPPHEPKPTPPGYPKINALLPDWTCAEVFVVDDDGTERPLDVPYERVEWSCAEGGVPTARITFVGAAIDAVGELEAEVSIAPSEQCPVTDGEGHRCRLARGHAPRAHEALTDTRTWREVLTDKRTWRSDE